MIKQIVGCLVIKDNSFVLVQEAQKHCYGKWNLPAGHLEDNEDIISGAIREAQEETGLELEPKGFLGIYQHKIPEGSVIITILAAEPLTSDLKYQEGELLDARWFSFKQFEDMPKNELRGAYIIEVLKDYRKRGFLPLECIHYLPD